MPKKTVRKKFKQGKVNRHKKLQKKLDNKGFGKPWSGECKWFRVEFSYYDEETDEDSKFQIPHWVSCRHFVGEERRFLMANLSNYRSTELTERESLESVYVSIYVANFLCYLGYGEQYNPQVKTRLPEDFDRTVNQAFISPASSKNDETIREPLYHWQIKEDMCSPVENEVAATFRNCLYHEF